MHFAARARLVGGIWVAQGEGGGGGRLILPQQAGAAAQHPPLSIHWAQGGPATSWSVTFHSLCCHLVKKHLHPLHPEHPWPWVSLKTPPGSPAPAKAAPPAWCVSPWHSQGDTQGDLVWRNDAEHPPASLPACPTGCDTGGHIAPRSTSTVPKGGEGNAICPQAHTRTGLSPRNPRPGDMDSKGALGQHRFCGTPFWGSEPSPTTRMLAAHRDVLENPGFIFI